MPDYRFGTEVSSKVKSISGLKGLIHSDEDMGNYRFSDEEVKKIHEELDIKKNDAFVLILGSKKEIEKATKVIIDRVKLAFDGVPPETRRALENGNTEFLRELHGGARLYPDTDSKAIMNTVEEIDAIRANLPKYPWDVIIDYSKTYDTEPRMIKELIFSGKLELFEKLVEIYSDNPSIILSTLLETSIALKRDGKEIDNINNEDYKEIFTELKNNNISKEAIEDIMIMKSEHPELTLKQIKQKLDIKSVSIEELTKIISKIIDNNNNLIRERGMKAIGPLMGDVMKQVRGKIDGAIVSDKLKDLLMKKIKELK